MSQNGCSTLTLTQALSSSRFLHVDILHRPNLQSLRHVAVRRSGSRCPSLFLVELGAAIVVASTTASALSPKPLFASIALIASTFLATKSCLSRKFRRRRKVVSNKQLAYKTIESRINLGMVYSKNNHVPVAFMKFIQVSYCDLHFNKS